MGAQAAALTPQERRHWTRVGMLAGLALVLGYLDTLVPIPVPGVKLGLANVAVLLALTQGDVAGAVGVAAIKALAGSLLYGSPVTLAYSAAGTALSLVVMMALSRVAGMHVVVVSVAGAMAHEVGQLAVAQLMLGTAYVWYAAPVLLSVACAAGTACGLVAAAAARALDGDACGLAASSVPSPDEPGMAQASTSCDYLSRGSVGGPAAVHASPAGALPSAVPAAMPPSLRLDARLAILALVAYLMVMVRLRGPVPLAVGLVPAVVACVLTRVSARSVMRAMRPVAAIALVSACAHLVGGQDGAVVARVGPVAVTATALEALLAMTVRLLAITAAGLAFMQVVTTEGIIDAVSWLTRPLSAVGVRTAGIALALGVALESAPLLADAMGAPARLAHAHGGVAAWRDALCDLVVRTYRTADAMAARLSTGYPSRRG